MTKPNKNQTLKRVKVYLLSDTWIDNGTGYCFGEIMDDQTAYLIVKNELDEKDELLRAKIEGNIQFQRQQDTLIVWTDLQGQNIALSFQEKDGCSSLCDFLIKVHRGNLAPEISLVSVITNEIDGDITELITGPINYPPIIPEADDLYDILNCFNENSNSAYYKQSISNFISMNNYLPKLIKLFQESEDNRNIKSLHLLCNIIKSLILYNEGVIIELILDDNHLMGVVGILEYDPDYPQYKSNHRSFLKDDSKFKEVLPLKNDHVKHLIKRTYILQFLKDVVLARLLDDPTFSFISTLIHFNEVEIIEFLEKNQFIDDLFALYKTEDTNEELLRQRRDCIKLLHQFVLIAKSLQPHQKTSFYKSLIKRGLLKTINFILGDDSGNVRVLGTEIIVAIIEHDVLLINGIIEDDLEENEFQGKIDRDNDNTNGNEPVKSTSKLDFFRSDDYEKVDDDDDDYPAKDLTNSSYYQHKNISLSDDMTLLLVLTKFLLEDKNPGLRIQAFEALKSLLDPINNFNIPLNQQENDLAGIQTLDYFNAFYAKVAPLLFKPLIELKQDDDTTEDDELHIYLCELIIFCSKDRTISRSFFLENHILQGISKLIQPTHKLQLRLAAVRSLKSIIQLNDDYYTRYIISEDLFHEIFNLFEETKGFADLTYSTILHLFEIILSGFEKIEDRKNYKLLARYIVTNYKSVLIKYDTVNSGPDLIKAVEDQDNSVNKLDEREDLETDYGDDDDDDNDDGNDNDDENEEDEERPEILTEPLQEEDILTNELIIKQNEELLAKDNEPISTPKKIINQDEKVDKALNNSVLSNVFKEDEDSALSTSSPLATKRLNEDEDHDLNGSDIKRKVTLKQKFANAGKKIASKFTSK
ncbi:hypothetical protein WICMUC_004043 [Wickerhamomyces mucosus]|uniref:Serine/threonine-protein phosphatase 4 regulatory subunit 3-like central domain-containing protein n=1 Tax=Wickerhamomyces mucosus TaxID=1378264 RepID=A0A9P8PIT5_9ASCO|nr:hypothetical protein WICMUC_004043 [Wickerhamomyces mucosus]